VRHLASAVKDGKVHYFLVDGDEGELIEFATIMVPENWSIANQVMLGSNLVSAIGLNGHSHGRARQAQPVPVGGAAPAELPMETADDGTLEGRVLAYIADHEGCRQREIVTALDLKTHQVGSALKRLSQKSRAQTRNTRWYLSKPAGGERRGGANYQGRRWQVTTEQVVAYVTEHPGANRKQVAAALIGDDSPAAAQAISNRCQVAYAKGLVHARPDPSAEGQSVRAIRLWPGPAPDG
jgi:hypothetical protein